MRPTLKPALIATTILLPLFASAANGTADSYFSNPLFNALLTVIIILAIIIMALAGAMKNLIGSDMFQKKLKEKAAAAGAGKRSLMVAALLSSAEGFAQSTGTGNTVGGLDNHAFYIMTAIIAAELVVLGVLFSTFRIMLGVQQKSLSVAAQKAVKRKPLLDKVNATVTLEEEDSIMLDHDYDGIRELDNVLPPWWKYGFYLTIVVAFIYMVVYHVTDSLPLQKSEYETSLRKAESEVAEYMKNSANNVDETTIKMLTDPADLNAGKDIYTSSCVACHGRFGEGGVGPNLTDDYWMHKGGIADIFKSIKYGWPDKGMKSWKEDFSPMQIAQITSYIKSLQGSNPPNAKEKQGELYTETASTQDSLVSKPDTLSRLTSEALRAK